MRATVAKYLRHQAWGQAKSYVRSEKGTISLNPYCWRAIYQRLKKERKHGITATRATSPN
jgi:hypothetical protein